MKALRDFRCSDCKETFDKITDKTTNIECPKCGSLNTEQVIGASAIKVNGQGAYTNKMKV